MSRLGGIEQMILGTEVFKDKETKIQSELYSHEWKSYPQQ